MKIGLALGSGGARGAAHIAVIRRLLKLGIEPDVVAGTSIGALIGAVHALGQLDDFYQWLNQLGRTDYLRLAGFNLFANGGLADAQQLMQTLRKRYGDPDIEDLALPFACVATDLETGHEVWLQQGNLWDAVRCSIAIPGLIAPFAHDDMWLVDGGLVNPIPVSLCRAKGAESIIAVDLNHDIMRSRRPAMQAKHTGIHKPAAKEPELLKDAQTETNPLKRVTQSIIDQTQALWGDSPNDESAQAPSTLGAIMRSVDIVHDRITRARMAGEPADIVLSPRLGEIHSLDFAKMDEAYEAGVTSVDLHEAALRYEFASLAHPVD